MTPHASHTSRGARVARLAVLVGLLVALLAGCNTTAIVRVDVKPNGSGTVEVDVLLDAEAAAKVGDLSKVVQFDDLRKAGWTIEGPSDWTKLRGLNGLPKGTIEVRATRPFDNVEQANKILTSISGPDGPLKGVKLTRSSSFTSTKFTAVGTVDLSKGLDAFGDSDLTKALGAPVAEAAQQFNGGKPVTGDLKVDVQVGSTGGLHWTGKMGDGGVGVGQVAATSSLGAASDRFDVRASQTHWTAILLAALAVLAVLGALVLTLVPLLPGRGAPRPPKRKRQRHSATDAWDYVAGRDGTQPLDAKAAKQAHRGKRGRHSRARGSGMTAWKLDEITVDPEEQVVAQPVEPQPDDPS